MNDNTQAILYKIIEILSKYRIIGEQKNGGRWAEIEGEIKTEYVAQEIEDLFLNDNACINMADD